ncbi:MAG: hypothetical protein L6Q92_16175 [Phycisphaerae bacterium]|nr:hypothetical protein [Phycisphaerae bacterium]
MSEPGSNASAMMIRKRDGASEPFEHAKLVECLRRVLIDVNDVDPPATAEGLADAVRQALHPLAALGPVRSLDLLELTESVLIRSGHASAAHVLHQHGRRRDRLRRLLHVARLRPAQRRYTNRRWSKASVVAAFEQEHGLSRGVARQLAGLVELAILRSGLRLVTTGFVRETMVSELLAWGLADEALTVTRSRGSRRPQAHPRTRSAE